jgi:hypothetical protein
VCSATAGGNVGEALELAARHQPDFLGQIGALNAVAQGIGFRLGGVTFAQFAADHPDLFAKEVVALALREGAGDFALDLRSQRIQFELPLQQWAEQVESIVDGGGFEQALLLRQREIHGTRDQVGQAPRLGDVGRRHLDVVADGRRHLEQFLEPGLKGAGLGLDARGTG